MALNIEIKARIPSVESLLQPAAAIATEGPVEILQEDTFFRCAAGRLKLRAFSDDAGELIFYRRDDEAGPKQSFYLRSPTTTPTVRTSSGSAGAGDAACAGEKAGEGVAGVGFIRRS